MEYGYDDFNFSETLNGRQELTLHLNFAENGDF